MVYAALGVALVIAFMLGARWYVGASPANVIRVLKWGSISLIGLAGGYLALTGRLSYALFAAPVIVALVNRIRLALRGGGASGGGAARTAPSGQTSEVSTAFVRMVLDHDSGEMNGDVLAGRYRGRTLRSLSLNELVAVLAEARDDPESVQILSAYLDRYHADTWRAQGETGSESGAESGAGGGAARGGAMSRDEALEILGLEPGADAAAIKAAYHRLMGKIHPDLGGSNYLATQINQAKDVLLGS